MLSFLEKKGLGKDKRGESFNHVFNFDDMSMNNT